MCPSKSMTQFIVSCFLIDEDREVINQARSQSEIYGVAKLAPEGSMLLSWGPGGAAPWKLRIS